MREKRNRIEAIGTQVAFVHMSTEEEARAFFEKHGLPDVIRISNLQQDLYRAFELRRAGAGELLGPSALWRGLKTAIFKRHGMGRIAGDGLQMSGVFLLHQGKILKSHYYREPWDHPDFEKLAHPTQ